MPILGLIKVDNQKTGLAQALLGCPAQVKLFTKNRILMCRALIESFNLFGYQQQDPSILHFAS